MRVEALRISNVALRFLLLNGIMDGSSSDASLICLLRYLPSSPLRTLVNRRRDYHTQR